MEKVRDKGHLKIFFGYAAGVGKTYSMLKAAHAAKQRGIDVVCGYIEPHGRTQTAALMNGLKNIPPLKIMHNSIELREFDIDAAIARHPQLILVDELAHTNADGCRHSKRYQDIQELLAAGIDVYTTVNVQHIESLNDLVASITGITVRERIPDSVFDDSDQVELVDIEPQELIDRFKSGNVYSEVQDQRAADNFFTVENLTALREIALRRCADRVNILTESTRIKNNSSYHTDEHILVCLSSAPSNAKIIRTAARMASAFRGAFTALFVETPDFETMSEENKKRLRSNMRLAQQLGASIETVYGEDVSLQISEFARLSGVSKIVIGRSAAARKHIFNKPTLTEKLIATSPDLDIYVIPDTTGAMSGYRPEKSRKKGKSAFSIPDILKSASILAAASLIGMIFDSLGFTEVNIITVYILGVLLISVAADHRIYSLLSSVISVIVFNFLFTEPRYTLLAYDSGYPVTFVVMFLAAFITGSLAVKLKSHAHRSAQAAYRTKVLFDTNQLLQRADDNDEIIAVTAGQLVKLLDTDVIVYPATDGKLGEPHIFTVDGEAPDADYTSDNERAVAGWVLKNNKHAGATTDTLSSAKCLYLSIRVNHNVYGVAGIAVKGGPPDAFESSIMLSILGESALAMENEKNYKEKEEAAVVARNEQLRSNLLRAISHDLRTPLTSISGNASNLMSNGESFDISTRKRLYSDIYDDSMWLINLVENLLSVTRLDDGRMQLHISAELMEDVVSEALLHINRKGSEHNIVVNHSDEFLLARMDAKLIVQVIINIVDNAIKYTPAGSNITIETMRQGNEAVVRIADDGPGIPDDAKKRVFDMFYSGANKVADSRRSLGLGLALCKSIITVHGGKITVEDNKPHGTIFSFTLPAEEAHLNE
ncbi:MAG: DUF4118 domain-containing protein [Anaerovoracaceae bacterium]